MKPDQDNVKFSKPVVVGETPKLPEMSAKFKAELKKKIKEIVKKHLDEMSTAAAAGSGPGSAGVPQLPMRRAKVDKSAVAKSVPGGKVVGSSDTGTLEEKKDETPTPKKDKPEKKQKTGHDEPMIKPDDDLTIVKKALSVATKRLDKLTKKGKVE
jgi:hypothetical protein